jgi:hypothetical protein
MVRQLSDPQESAGGELRLGSANHVNTCATTLEVFLTYSGDQGVALPLSLRGVGVKRIQSWSLAQVGPC